MEPPKWSRYALVAALGGNVSAKVFWDTHCQIRKNDFSFAGLFKDSDGREKLALVAEKKQRASFFGPSSGSEVHLLTAEAGGTELERLVDVVEGLKRVVEGSYVQLHGNFPLEEMTRGSADDEGVAAAGSGDRIVGATECPVMPSLSPKKIPVTILMGSLGAGKTTLMHHILQSGDPGIRYAIITDKENHVVPQNTLVTHTEKVKEEIGDINSEGFCYSVRGDLVAALKTMHDKVDSFDAVLMETTSLTDPAPVVRTFFADVFIRQQYVLDGIITVVNVENILTHLDERKPDGFSRENEISRHIAFADCVLLNKVDLLSQNEELLLNVEKRIRKLNKQCPIIRCQNGNVPVDKLLNLDSFNPDKTLEKNPDFFKNSNFPEQQHDERITRLSCNFVGDLTLDTFQVWASDLPKDKSQELYRSKGVLSVKDEQKKFVIEGVGMDFFGHFSDIHHWGKHEKRECTFVCIGSNLNRENLASSFLQCKTEEGTLKRKGGDKALAAPSGSEDGEESDGDSAAAPPTALEAVRWGATLFQAKSTTGPFAPDMHQGQNAMLVETTGGRVLCVTSGHSFELPLASGSRAVRPLKAFRCTLYMSGCPEEDTFGGQGYQLEGEGFEKVRCFVQILKHADCPQEDDWHKDIKRLDIHVSLAQAPPSATGSADYEQPDLRHVFPILVPPGNGLEVPYQKVWGWGKDAAAVDITRFVDALQTQSGLELQSWVWHENKLMSAEEVVQYVDPKSEIFVADARVPGPLKRERLLNPAIRRTHMERIPEGDTPLFQHTMTSAPGCCGITLAVDVPQRTLTTDLGDEPRAIGIEVSHSCWDAPVTSLPRMMTANAVILGALGPMEDWPMQPLPSQQLPDGTLGSVDRHLNTCFHFDGPSDEAVAEAFLARLRSTEERLEGQRKALKQRFETELAAVDHQLQESQQLRAEVQDFLQTRRRQ